MKCSDEFGIYSSMVTLEMPPHLFKENGGYYTEKKTCDVDLCLVDEIKYLWSKGVVTTGCCCGHGINEGLINVLESSADLMIALGYQYLDVPEGCWKYSFVPKSKHHMENIFPDEEVKKAKSVIESKPDYKVADIQRAILKGYMYTARLIEYIKNK